MAAVRHVKFVHACVGTTHEGHLLVFITVESLVGIDAVVDNMYFFRFRDFGLKTAIRGPNFFWGV